MTDTPATPEVVNPSAVPPVAKSVLSDLLVVTAAFPIIVKLLGAHDLTKLLQWMQSADGAAFLAVVLPILASGWRARSRVKRWAKAIHWAREAPNSVVVVKEPTPPPAAD